MWETALTDHLEDDTDVGASLATRIYPIFLPQQVIYPAATFHLISDVPVYAHDLAGPEALRIQIDVWAVTHLSARTIADQVRDALEGFRGMMGGVYGVPIGGVLLENQTAFYEDEPRIFRISTDYIFWKEAA